MEKWNSSSSSKTDASKKEEKKPLLPNICQKDYKDGHRYETYTNPCFRLDEDDPLNKGASTSKNKKK